MRHVQSLTLVLALTALVAGQAQDGAATAAAPGPEKEQAIAAALGTFLDTDRFADDRKKNESAFLEVIGMKPPEDGKALDPVSGTRILTQVASWERIFGRVAARHLKEKPAGSGRLRRRERVERTFKGEPMAFEYACRVPRDYDGSRAWPLLLILPPIDVEARHHMQKVWLDKSADEALVEKYILLAPTLSERTRTRDKKESTRILGFGRMRTWNVYWPLVEVMKLYNVDTDRIHVVGTGTGGEIALELASLRMKDFASVSVRNAAFDDADLAANTGDLTVNFHLAAGEGGEKLKARIEKVREATGGKYTVTMHQVPKGDVEQIKPATNAILGQIDEVRRNAYPASTRLLTRMRSFATTPWFRLRVFALNEKAEVYPSVTARADREKNVVHLETKNVERLTLYLNDVLLDLDKPFKVMANGKEVATHEAGRDLDVMLDYFRDNPYDPRAVFTRIVDVDVPLPEPKKPEDEKKPDDAGKDGKANDAAAPKEGK